MDVCCGALAQTKRLVKKGETVAILGAGGNSDILCAYQTKKILGEKRKITVIQHSDKGVKNWNLWIYAILY